MNVLCHHIYEYKKGVRNLVLHTLSASHKEEAIKKLKASNIDFIVRSVSEQKINIFFGKKECIEVIEQFGDIKLNNLTAEQDFILGTMLGYSRTQQCERYLKQKKRQKSSFLSVV